MPANANPLRVLNLQAAADIGQFAAVSSTGTLATAGSAPIGFTTASGKSGTLVPVAVMGSAVAWAGAAIALGQRLEIGANGTVVPLAAGIQVGTALNAAASGDQVEVMMGVPASVSGAGNRRDRPLPCAVFGPSHANLNPPNTDVRLLVGAMGSSPTSISPERWQVNTFYPVAYPVANGGVSSNTTADMLARSDAVIATTRKSIQDVIDTRPEVVFLASLDTNDFASLNAGNYAATVAATVANHRQIVRMFLSAGIYVIDEGNYPYSATAHTTPSLTRQAILETNATYAADAALYPTQMEFLSAASVLGDASGNYLPNCSQNDANVGLHKSMYGEWLLSQSRAAALTRKFGVSRGFRYAGANLLNNATTASRGNNSLIGRTAASVGGLKGEGWTHNANANVTQNLGSIQVIDGKRYSMMLGTSTAANSQQMIYFPLDAANFGLVSGDIVGLEFDMYVSDANDGPPPILTTTTSRFNLINNVPATLGWTNNQNASVLTARSFPGPFKQHVVFPPLQLPAPGTLTTAEFWCEWKTDELVQWKFGCANPRLVKIGSGGVLDAWQV